MTYGLNADCLQVKCRGGHQHLRIQGAIPKTPLSMFGTWQGMWPFILHEPSVHLLPMVRLLMSQAMKVSSSMTFWLVRVGPLKRLGTGGGRAISTCWSLLRAMQSCRPWQTENVVFASHAIWTQGLPNVRWPREEAHHLLFRQFATQVGALDLHD